MAKGELQMASDSFKIVLDEDGNNFPALLGQVISFRLLKWSNHSEIWYFQIVGTLKLFLVWR